MSYAQAMKWHKKHPRGGKKQYMGFDTGLGRWPAAICKQCSNNFNSENHQNHCGDPRYGDPMPPDTTAGDDE